MRRILIERGIFFSPLLAEICRRECFFASPDGSGMYYVEFFNYFRRDNFFYKKHLRDFNFYRIFINCFGEAGWFVDRMIP